MNVDWSFHFEEQFQRIIATIVQAQSYEDGIEWHERIGGQISLWRTFRSWVTMFRQDALHSHQTTLNDSAN